jgi:glycosyltransferase involved in cell wall biosynthesis
MNYRTNELLNWHVEYAGPDYDGHLAQVQNKIRELGVEDNFTYLGNLGDNEKWTAYRRADVFVLPTYSENFGIVVAEALYAEIPVITTKGTPWSELRGVSESGGQPASLASFSVPGRAAGRGQTTTSDPAATGRCGWWIDIGVESLSKTVQEAVNLTDSDRYQMGLNGRVLIEKKYTWPAAAMQMKSAYEWLLHGGEKPDCVQTT